MVKSVVHRTAFFQKKNQKKKKKNPQFSPLDIGRSPGKEFSCCIPDSMQLVSHRCPTRKIGQNPNWPSG